MRTGIQEHANLAVAVAAKDQGPAADGPGARVVSAG